MKVFIIDDFSFEPSSVATVLQWDYQQIGSYNRSDFYPLLMQASEKYKNGDYIRMAKAINDKGENVMVSLLYQQ